MSGNLESRIWINGVLFHLNKLQNYLFIYFNVFSVLSICMSVENVHVWCPERPEKGIRTPVVALQMFVSCHLSAKAQT